MSLDSNENRPPGLQEKKQELAQRISLIIDKYNSTERTENNFKTVIDLLSQYDALLAKEKPYKKEDHLASLRAAFQGLDLSALTKEQKKYISQSFKRSEDVNDRLSINQFLSHRIQEDKLIKQSKKVVHSQKEAPLLYAAQKIDYHLNALRQENKIVYLADAAVNAIIEYKQIQERKNPENLAAQQEKVAIFKDNILKLCSEIVKKEIEDKLAQEVTERPSSQNSIKPKSSGLRENLITFLSKNLILPGQNNIITLKKNDPEVYEKYGKTPPNMPANSSLDDKKDYLQKIIDTHFKQEPVVPSDDFINALPPHLIDDFFDAESIEARCKALTKIQLSYMLFSAEYLSKNVKLFGGEQAPLEPFSIDHSVKLDAAQFNSTKDSVVVFLYGNADFYQRHLKEMQELANLKDCRVIGFNLPGVGLSEGEVRSERDMIDAAKAVIATLHQDGNGVPLEQIMFVGESMGAAVLTIAADQYSQAYHQTKPEKPADREEPHIFNARSFSTLAKAAAGFVSRNKTIGNILAAVITPILKSLGFELDAGKSYTNMKPENREHLFVKKDLAHDSESKSDNYIASFAFLKVPNGTAHQVISRSTNSHNDALEERNEIVHAFVEKRRQQTPETLFEISGNPKKNKLQ